MFSRIIIFCTVVILASCSSFKLSYRFADWMLLYKLGDYIDLTSEQENRAKTEIDNLIRWYSQIELPRYIKILQNVKADIHNGTFPARWSIYQADYQLGQKRLLQKIIPPLSKILLNLDAGQLQKLRRKLLSGNDKLRSIQRLGVKVRKDIRLTWYLENYTYWLGQLTEKQTAQIAKFASSLPLTLESRLDYRIRAETIFFRLIQQPELKAQKVEELLESLRSEKARQQRQENGLVSLFLPKFSRTVTGEQKKYLIAQIDAVITDFKDIIKTQTDITLAE
jgi:hypothetical protein